MGRKGCGVGVLGWGLGRGGWVRVGSREEKRKEFPSESVFCISRSHWHVRHLIFFFFFLSFEEKLSTKEAFVVKGPPKKRKNKGKECKSKTKQEN